MESEQPEQQGQGRMTRQTAKATAGKRSSAKGQSMSQSSSASKKPRKRYSVEGAVAPNTVSFNITTVLLFAASNLHRDNQNTNACWLVNR